MAETGESDVKMDRGGNNRTPAGTGGKAVLVDAAVRRRAVTDFSESLCVEAGAGTGKTKLLVDRFLEIIRTGRARCSQVVAITFTEKAAGEMKVRLRDEIESLLPCENLDEVERGRLAAARDELERAPISTIHSFASAVLREYPIDAGIDPSFTQLDALEGSLFVEECWTSFLEQTTAPFDSLLRRLFLLEVKLDRIKDVALHVYERRGERYVTGAYAAGSNGDGDRDTGASAVSVIDDFSDACAIREELREKVRALSALADAHCVDESDRGCRLIRDLEQDTSGLAGFEGEDLEYLILAMPLPRLNAGKRSNWKPDEACAEQKSLVGEARGLLEEYRTRVADRLRDCLSLWLEDFIDYVDARKAEGSMLDFDDLLIKTRVLVRNDNALQSLRRRYRYILVDEFQDTDPLQAEIVLLLAGLGESQGDDGIEPGKLFIVGDPKQSIYRFRKADVEIYEEVKERLSRGGSHLTISQNFRSVPGITRWVNGAFTAIIQKPEEGRFQPSYEPIHPYRAGNGPAVIQLDLGIQTESAGADDVRLSEGQGIARLIRWLVSQGIVVGDAERGMAHPLCYKDIAILYPGTTGIEYYEDPLRVDGIPYIVEGGKLYYTRQEVRDLAEALWAVEDPWDRLSLVAALRSPLFGFSDEEIFLYIRTGGRLNYLESSPSREGRFADLAEAFELLADLHRRRNERGPAGTIARLLYRTKFGELSFLRLHGEQRILNINKAVQLARAFESGMHSYRRFAEWFRRQHILGTVESESPLVDGSEDAVRLITIHRSKGLQFPVVILANLLQRRSRSSNILLEKGARLALKLGSDLKTSDFDAVKERENLRDEAEVARLLYVAATRAGDILVIPRTPRKGSYFELIEQHLPANGETGGSITPDVVTQPVSDLPVLRGESKPFVRLPKQTKRDCERAIELKNEWLTVRSKLLERGARCPQIITPSGSEMGVGAMDRTGDGGPRREIDEDGETRACRPSTAGDREHALRFGSAFHRLMEIVDLAGKGDMDRMARAVALDHGIVEEAGELGLLVRRALDAEPLRSASVADRVLREVPFIVPVSVVVNDVPAVHFLEGRIDLIFELNGTWTVIDYKTDSVSDDEVDERFELYRTQGMLYAAALSRSGVTLGGGVLFYFVRPDQMRRLTVDGELLERGKKLIDEVILDRFTWDQTDRQGRRGPIGPSG
jgi:ATP-dependent helicase/nuclease subunit A